MNGIWFEWDEAKNLANQRKHGVSFEDASEVFRDPLFVSVKDRIQDGEQRWRTYGVVDGSLLMMVAHTVREEDAHGTTIEKIRIISARYATRKERQRYEYENR
ncbi:MAG: BrnT family toxin [Terracidiphilus sp.]